MFRQLQRFMGQPDHTNDSLETIKAAIDDDSAILIDVREQDEWDAGHLTSAKLVPLSDLREPADRERIAAELPRDKTIYCHCKSGGRVLMAKTVLDELGFDIQAMREGFDHLVQAGFERAN